MQLPLRPLALLTLALLGGASACQGGDEEAARVEVQHLASQSSSDAPADAEKVARRGRSALPLIEAQLHTADAPGRKNLILALRKIGDADAVPLLRHIALFDDAEDVRREAEWTLQQWAAGKDARADRARAALREVDERRGREENG